MFVVVSVVVLIVDILSYFFIFEVNVWTKTDFRSFLSYKHQTFHYKHYTLCEVKTSVMFSFILFLPPVSIYWLTFNFIYCLFFVFFLLLFILLSVVTNKNL